MNRRVVVIGAGIAGLAAAVLGLGESAAVAQERAVECLDAVARRAQACGAKAPGVPAVDMPLPSPGPRCSSVTAGLSAMRP